MDLRGGSNINDYAEHSDNVDSWWVDNDKYPPGYHRHHGPTNHDRVYHSHDSPRNHEHLVSTFVTDSALDVDPAYVQYNEAIYPNRS